MPQRVAQFPSVAQLVRLLVLALAMVALVSVSDGGAFAQASGKPEKSDQADTQDQSAKPKIYTVMKPTKEAPPPPQYIGAASDGGGDVVIVPLPQAPVRAVGPAPSAAPAVVSAQGPRTIVPPSLAPQVAPPVAAAAPPPQGQQAVERVLERKMGSENFGRLMNDLASAKGDDGRGAPTANTYFDRAAPRMAAAADANRGTGTPVFGQQQSSGSFLGATAADADATLRRYDSIPGGVVLEGMASFGQLDSLGYDARFNAFVLNDNAVYFSRVPPADLATICHALAKDDRLGVSLGAVQIVYGGVPPDSKFALDMKIADHFMGGITFAYGSWTTGYRFAKSYKPQPNQSDSSGNVAVFFNFTGFGFDLADGEIRSTRNRLDVRLFPLAREAGPDGSHQPDMDRIASGDVSPQYQANARHIAENIDYYRKEPIIDRMFAYGEAAAFLRAMKYSGFDLDQLADQIG